MRVERGERYNMFYQLQHILSRPSYNIFYLVQATTYSIWSKLQHILSGPSCNMFYLVQATTYSVWPKDAGGAGRAPEAAQVVQHGGACTGC